MPDSRVPTNLEVVAVAVFLSLLAAALLWRVWENGSLMPFLKLILK